MNTSCANSFVYAKSSGILARSFIRKKAESLYAASSLEELWHLLFAQDFPCATSVEIAKEIEKKSFDNFVKEFISLLACYSKQNQFFEALILNFEVANLKLVVSSLADGKTALPDFKFLGNHQVIKYFEWPNLQKMVSETHFEWILDYSINEPKKQLNHYIDQHYVIYLFQSLFSLPTKDRKIVGDYIFQFYEFNNIVWALRLKIYYKMKKETILPLLLKKSLKNAETEDALCKNAINLLDLPLDEFSLWEKSCIKDFVNPVTAETWKIDVKYVQKQMMKKLYDVALKIFRQNPCSKSCLAVFYYLKLFELDFIRSATETCRLNADKLGGKNGKNC